MEGCEMGMLVHSVKAVNALVVYRAFAGVSIWVAPGLTARFFGFKPDRGQFYVGRLAGSRQVALAAGTLLSDGEARRLWLRLGLICDVLDTAAAAIAGGKRDSPPKQAAGTGAATLVEAALSTMALAEHEHLIQKAPAGCARVAPSIRLRSRK
jgi:hypothetical protein